MTKQATPLPSKTEILRSLGYLMKSGHVVEMRAIGVQRGNRRTATLAGYFNDSDLLANAAFGVSPEASGVYITVNHINPALLARMANKIGEITTNGLTKDDEVVRLLWLPIDLDPVRPAHISSSEPEHKLAGRRVEEIHRVLTSMDWPEPILADSGNGGHMLYAIDLPPDGKDLVRKCLQTLALLFDTDEVRVDQGVFNPSRIWKLWGTVSRKGDNTLDRPHRLSRILRAPTMIQPVSVPQLEALAAKLPPLIDTATRSAIRTSRCASLINFDAQWIQKLGLEVRGPSNWNDGKRWVFPTCPWNENHRNSAYIVQLASGGIAAGCHHTACADRNWQSLRELLDPKGAQQDGIERALPDRCRVTLARGGRGLTRDIADSIVSEYHFARDVGGRLYIFEAGTYEHRGEFHIKRKVKHWLRAHNREADWERRLGEEVLEYIRLDTPELLIGHEPPCDLLNVRNGLLDLSTGELRPHTPEFLYPVQIPVVYDPCATCSEIDRFISQVFPDDAQELAWDILGDGLTPDRSIQKAILLTGEGGNGKGVFLALYVSLLGRKNVSAVSLPKLEEDRFAVARLYGKLANVCADLPSGHLAGTSVFKSITGNDIIVGEYKFKDSFEFRAYCRLIFSANHPPQSKDASKAFYDRWIVVPFNRSFRNTEQEIPRNILDKRLHDRRELSGALNKALAALRRVRAAGRFTEAESTHLALSEFREVTDPVAIWLDRETVLHPSAFVTQKALHTAYNLACEHAGRPPMTKQAFGRAFKRDRPNIEEAQRTISSKVQWVYLGLGLKTQLSQGVSSDSRDSLDFCVFRRCRSLIPI